MTRKRKRGHLIRAAAFGAVLAMALAAAPACASHLRNAKTLYARAGEEAARSHVESAAALYKKARLEAGREAARKPSAQAYLVKGLAEVDLGMWKEAEASFVKAFSFGQDSAQAWASDAALIGLAASFEELGFDSQASRIYADVMKKSKFRPAVRTAASKRTEAVLRASLDLPDKEKDKALSGLLRELDSALTDDYACGLLHYLVSQVCGHTGDLLRAYEEAVIARELGLPSDKMLRDNDNQLVFCYKELSVGLPSSKKEEFEARHRTWTARWGWTGPETPAWKKE